MPTFEIPDGPTTVELKRSGDAKSPATGSIVFNVTNKSPDGCLGRLSVVPSGSSKAEWFAVGGDRERTFAPGETQTATIQVTAPTEVAAGDYPFRLRAVAVNDPDNDHAEGPVATAKVPAAPVIKKGGIPWWVWLILGLVLLIGLGVGGYFLFRNPGGGEKKHEQKTGETSATVPNFVDKTVEQAKGAAQGFEIVEVAGPAAGKQPGTIISQVPAAGKKQDTGAVIKVTFDPGVTVPSLIGQNVGQAVRTLQNVPLHVQQSTTRCDDAGTPDEIVEQSPLAGKPAAKDSGVDITVRTIGGVFFGRMRVACGRAIPMDELILGVKASPQFQTMTATQKMRAVQAIRQ